MLTVNIICVGKLKEEYLRKAQSEYLKRLSSFCRGRVIEIPEFRLPDSPSAAEIEKGLISEGKALQAKCRGFSVALCIEGEEIDSPSLAKKLNYLATRGESELSFLIGGSYGLSDQIKRQSNMRLSMSPMTFPHQLARIMLLEQIYRAFSINGNGKYHK